jgi:hypothetical protein
MTSAGIGLCCLAGTSATGLPVLTGLFLAGVSVVASGAVESYRLGRREDARTVSEWASARHRPAGEPGEIPVKDDSKILVKDGRRPGHPARRG